MSDGHKFFQYGLWMALFILKTSSFNLGYSYQLIVAISLDRFQRSPMSISETDAMGRMETSMGYVSLKFLPCLTSHSMKNSKNFESSRPSYRWYLETDRVHSVNDSLDEFEMKMAGASWFSPVKIGHLADTSDPITWYALAWDRQPDRWKKQSTATCCLVYQWEPL